MKETKGMKWKVSRHTRSGALHADLGIASMWVVPKGGGGAWFQVSIGGLIVRVGEALDIKVAKEQAMQALADVSASLYCQVARALHPEAEKLVREARRR